MKRCILYWAPVIAWAAIIFYFSSRQKIAVTDSYTLSFIFFKTLHLIEYAVLYILLYRAVRGSTTQRGGPTVSLITLGAVVLYAASDELHQYFVPTREGKVRDVIIDTLGGGIGWIVAEQFIARLPKKLRILAGW